MNNLKKYFPVPESPLVRLQYLSLFIAGLLEFLALAFAHNITHVLLHTALLGPVFLFWIAAFMQMRKSKTRYPLTLAVVLVVWFVVIQLFPRANRIEIHHFGLFFSVYLLALPFALVTRDEDKQIGLKAAALFYVAAALALVFYTVLLVANCVPAFLEHNFYMSWDGTRLNAILHPNVSSRVFMISIAFCLGFSAYTSKKHLKALFLIASAFMFIALSLTNSRAAILLTCLLAAGTAFLGIFKGTWKQFISGVAVGSAVLIVLFFTSQWLFQWNSDRLLNVQSQPPQISDFVDTNAPSTPLPTAPDVSVSAESANPQGTLMGDLPTLNNRTGIWKAAFRGIKQDPTILLWGTGNIEEIVGQAGGKHAHNAWLQILLRLGLPGLFISLFFTAQAIWSSACLLLHHQVSLWKKIIAMLVLCLLISAMLEPSLFFTDEMWHAPDFMFFLCLGYTVQWKKQLSKT